MESAYPGLTRPVLCGYRFYNQDLTTGSLLIEIGGHANTLDEALRAGEYAAKRWPGCWEGKSLITILIRGGIHPPGQLAPPHTSTHGYGIRPYGRNRRPPTPRRPSWHRKRNIIAAR